MTALVLAACIMAGAMYFPTRNADRNTKCPAASDSQSH